MQRTPASMPGRSQNAARPHARVRRFMSRRAALRLLPDLREGEKVVMLRRRHATLLVAQMTWPLVLCALWVIGFFALFAYALGSRPDPLVSSDVWPPAWLPVVLWAGWLLLGGGALVWGAYVALDWRDHWIALTTRRLVIMDRTLFIRETRREVPLAKVQNVVADYPNAVSMSLDFGDLTMDTAGIGVLTFKGLPRPRAMREAIFAQQKALRANQAPPEERRKAAVKAMLLGADPTSPDDGPGHRGPAGAQTGPRSERADAEPSNPPSVAYIGFFRKYFPFEPQRAGAGVTWHKHWLFLLRGVAWPILSYMAIWAGWIASLLLSREGGENLLAGVMGWSALLLAPFCLVWGLWNWEDWRNDLYKLDRERVYHIESLPFGLREQSKETLITRITDVTYIVPGPIANLLDFGDVVIKTPGESTEFVFRRIPHPREVQQEIMARVDEYRLKEGASVDHEIEAWLRAYHDVTRGA